MVRVYVNTNYGDENDSREVYIDGDNVQSIIEYIFSVNTINESFNAHGAVGSDVGEYISVNGTDNIIFSRSMLDTESLHEDVFQWTAQGYNVVSKVGSGIPSLFTSKDTSQLDLVRVEPLKPITRGIRLSQTDKLKKIIDQNWNELLRFGVKRYNLMCEWNQESKTYTCLNIISTLTKLRNMKCVWQGLQLAYIKNPLMDRIRELLKLPSDIVYNEKNIQISREIRKYAPLVSTRPTRDRPDKLIAYTIFELNSKYGYNLSSSDSVSMDQMYDISNILNVNIHIINERMYKTLITTISDIRMDTAAMEREKRSELRNRIKNTFNRKGIKPLSISMYPKQTPRSLTVDKIISPLVYIMIDEVDEETNTGHLDPVIDIDVLIKIASGFMCGGYDENSHIEYRKRADNGENYILGPDEIYTYTLPKRIGNPEDLSTPYYIPEDSPIPSFKPYDYLPCRPVKDRKTLLETIKGIKSAIQSGDSENPIFQRTQIDPSVFKMNRADIMNIAIGLENEKDTEYDKDVRDASRGFKEFVDNIQCWINDRGDDMFQFDKSKFRLSYKDYYYRKVTKVFREKIERDHKLSEAKQKRKLKEFLESDEFDKEIEFEQASKFNTNYSTFEGVCSFILIVKTMHGRTPVYGRYQFNQFIIPSTIVVDAIVDQYLNINIGDPIVFKRMCKNKYDIPDKIYKAGMLLREQKIASLKKISDKNEHSDKDKIDMKEIEAELVVSKNIPMWMKNCMMSVNLITGLNPELNKLVSTIDGLDVENGKIYNPTEWEVCTVHNSYDGRGYNVNEDVYELDQNSQYPQVMMGCGNEAFDLDFFGWYPIFPIVDNFSLQSIKRPIVSFFSDCGIINIDPSSIRVDDFNKITKGHSRVGSLLFEMITSENGTRVISSVNLITWTNDIWKEYMAKHDVTGSYDDYINFAEEFQLNILKIKTGRFLIDDETRELIYRTIKQFGRVDDHGEKMINEEFEYIQYKLPYILKHMFILPNKRNLVVKIRGEYRLNLLGMMKNHLKRYDRWVTKSVSIFRMLAKRILFLDSFVGCKFKQDGDMVEVTRKDIKCTKNTAIGKCRQVKSKGVQFDSVSIALDTYKGGEYTLDDMIEPQKNTARLDPACFDPSIDILLCSLPKSGINIVETYSAQRRYVRNTQEFIRDMVMLISGRIIEKVCIGLEYGPLRCKTDGIIVCKSDIGKAEILMQKYTKHVDVEVPGLPGYTSGYSKELITPAMAGKRYPFLKAKRVSHTLQYTYGEETIQYEPSRVKQYHDNKVWKVVYEDERLFKFHAKEGYPYGSDITKEELVKIYMKDVDLKGSGKLCQSEFKQLFETNERNYLKNKSILISGSPGTGKTYTVGAIYGTKNGECNVPSVNAYVPFHPLKKSFQDNCITTNTVHSLFLSSRSLAGVRKDPVERLNHKRSWTNNRNTVIFDEVESINSYAVEGFKVLAQWSGNMVFLGDKFQSPAINDSGMDMNGNTIACITDYNEYVKNIEKRNREQNYMDTKELTRQGEVMDYFSDKICTYLCGDFSRYKLLCLVKNVAEEYLKTGTSNTTLVCQNKDIEGMIIHTISRLIILNSTPDCVLYYCGKFGSGISHGILESRDAELIDGDVNDEGVYGYNERYDEIDKGKFRGPRYNVIAHGQGLTFVPMVFIPGTTWMVKNTVRPMTGTTLYKCDILTYKSFKSVDMVTSVKKNIVDGSIHTVYTWAKVRIFTFESNLRDDPVQLTEYDVVSSLGFPFTAQRCSLIGLTLNNVALIQLGHNYKKKGELIWTRSYTPLKSTLYDIYQKYGKYSYLSRTCRDLQVVLTRVKKGCKTEVFDLLNPNPKAKHFKRINFNACTGERCESFGSLISKVDRENLGGVNCMYTRVIEKVKKAKILKSKSLSLKDDIPIQDTNVFIKVDSVNLDFPVDRLCKDGITPQMCLDSLF